jgi:PAS domain S-box-containing protein
MNDAIIGTDRDGRIQLMNDAAEAITGWPAEAAVGRALAEVFQINGRAEGLHRLGNVLLTRDQRAVEIEGRAEGIRDSLGGLREIRVHFSRRAAEPIPWPDQPVPAEPLDAA